MVQIYIGTQILKHILLFTLYIHYIIISLINKKEKKYFKSN